MRKDITRKERDLLHLKSGGVCAFPDCSLRLVVEGTPSDDATTIGEIAHIVASSDQGPRASKAMSEEERNKHFNLILLCEPHHKVIDAQPNTYSLPVLRQMKEDHEDRIRRLTSRDGPPASPSLRDESIHSTLLTVTHLPDVVFAAACCFGDGQEDEVKKRIKYPPRREELTPFLLREGMLFAFHDLRDRDGPFSGMLDFRKIDRHRAQELWSEPEGMRRYVNLLNRSLYKHAGRLGVRYDPAHYRFYFPVDGPGKERSVSYRPLNAARAKRKVAWCPKKKATGEGRDFWLHLAAGLRFHRMGPKAWCLSLRPERHLTKDGEIPLESDRIGPKVTRLKARMFNNAYLGEINFWRDYLSGGKPRFILDYGAQSAIIDTRLLNFSVEWPGIPGDDLPFKNETYEDDWFSLESLSEATGGDEFDWGEDDDEGPE